MASRFVLPFALCAAALASNVPGETDWEEGIRLYRDEQYRDAQERFERAASHDPSNSRFQLWVGLAIGRRAEGMSGFRKLAAMSLAKQVRRQFEKAVELDPANLEALEALQGFHFEAPGLIGGDKARARSIAAEIEGIDKARGAAAWAACHADAGDFEKAAESFARARDLAPDEVRYLLGHASVLSRSGRHQESDRLFEVAFEREPESPDVWLAAARSWIRAKRRTEYQRARELLERYIDSPNRRLNSDPPSIVRKLLKDL